MEWIGGRWAWILVSDDAGARDMTTLGEVEGSVPVRGSCKRAKPRRDEEAVQNEEAERRVGYVMKERRLRRALRDTRVGGVAGER